MGILGNAGSLYMIFLIMLLVIGFGLFGLWMIQEALGFGQKVPNPKGNPAMAGKGNPAAAKKETPVNAGKANTTNSGKRDSSSNTKE